MISAIIFTTSATMLQLQLNNPSLLILGTNKSMFKWVPVESSCKHDYFNNRATQVLLTLTEEDYLQVTDMYGVKELGEYPVC